MKDIDVVERGETSSNLISICVPCVLKAASKKEESEEVQKEKEKAFLELSDMGLYFLMQEQYLKEITGIIKQQQKHRNLTKLAYQSAWEFLIYRFLYDNSLEKEIVNELHFGREAAREVKELMKCVNWKKKEEENGKRRREAKEVLIL
ncbi:uncharacterized protein MONOS_10243 [Monocercomonoides exilis]|uniref:uncharacterized protein n=1 Tax=Monocercomonoides exilis TaxID=2049356 RepID=UPI003559CABC|nr:hypothetical protein MONOS_10243 [Monocercomonoides exilis]|eukprot:MONOS_10243.1-p1 / transcript=MONOS_10243.1 / gene=MONOS_10243 / organism=Monocercomonoides_exilis_PA203 / gene_product=unspecified product / transcript_product=unspecified product / location=Mono_scaffold00457:45389-46026(+) / protein_length=148 / sequence_SO=supercontig / SO=protein_coding / is_pseudo=false